MAIFDKRDSTYDDQGTSYDRRDYIRERRSNWLPLLLIPIIALMAFGGVRLLNNARNPENSTTAFQTTNTLDSGGRVGIGGGPDTSISPMNVSPTSTVSPRVEDQRSGKGAQQGIGGSGDTMTQSSTTEGQGGSFTVPNAAPNTGHGRR